MEVVYLYSIYFCMISPLELKVSVLHAVK